MSVDGSGAAGGAAVARLGHDPEAFARGWPAAPVLARGGDATGLLTPYDVDEIVGDRGARLPGFRVVRDGQTLPAGDYTRSARVGHRSVRDLAHPGRIGELLDAGATLVLQGLHRTWPPLAAFCRDLARELGHPVQANAYLTPHRGRGFAPHHDTHDVFVVQTYGEKTWRLHAPVLPHPLPHQPSASIARGGPLLPPDATPDLTVTLSAGDCLWVPRGWVHAAETTGTPSLHVTVGVLALTRHWLLRQVVAALADDPRFRTDLPPRFATAGAGTGAVLAELAADVAAWARDADPEAVAHRVEAAALRELPGPRRTPVADALHLAPIGLDDELAVVASAVHASRKDGDALVLHLGDRELRLRGAAAAAAADALSRTVVRARDLVDLPDADERLAVTRRLVREGILRRL